jgi:hypothetical protein
MGRADNKRKKSKRKRATGGRVEVNAAPPRHPLMRLAMRLPLILIGVVVVLLIPAPFTEDSPELNDLYENYIGPIIIGAVLASILISSVVGAMIMMGWRAAIVGVVFTASITSAGAAAFTGDALWTNVGMGGFAISCFGYYLIGELSGYLPIPTAAAYGSVAMIPGGIIMAVIGAVSETDALILLGLGGAGAATGVAVARWYRRGKLAAAASTGAGVPAGGTAD